MDWTSLECSRLKKWRKTWYRLFLLLMNWIFWQWTPSKQIRSIYQKSIRTNSSVFWIITVRSLLTSKNCTCLTMKTSGSLELAKLQWLWTFKTNKKFTLFLMDWIKTTLWIVFQVTTNRSRALNWGPPSSYSYLKAGLFHPKVIMLSKITSCFTKKGNWLKLHGLTKNIKASGLSIMN